MLLKDLLAGKDCLEDHLVFWDQIKGSGEEVSSWLDSIVHLMEEQSNSFAEPSIVMNTLTKYKVMNNVQELSNTLIANNDFTPISVRVPAYTFYLSFRL